MKIVKANNNSPVRLREQPNGRVTDSIKQGTAVEVLKEDGEWSEIKIDGKTTGWMMSKFLIEQAKTDLSELKTKLKEVLQLLDKLESAN